MRKRLNTISTSAPAAHGARGAAPSRRVLLGGLAAVPMLGAAPAPAGLQGVAGGAGRLFGAAVRADRLAEDAALRAAVVRECGVVTPELEMKWAWLEPQPGVLHFHDVDRIAAFARTAGKTMHGHALLWHQSIPQWATGTRDWDSVARFIATTVTRYRDVAATWDVVNEPMEMGHRMDGLRPSPFLAAFGPGYIDRAFHAAREAAPKARLFVNEYDLDYDLPVQRDRRYLLLRLLERLKRDGVPIDGVGIQAHLDFAHNAAFDPRGFADFLNAIGGMGLEIRISELDVRDAAGARMPKAERERRAAAAIAPYLATALANRAVGTVSCWGLSNRYSWLGDTASLPLDAAMRPTAVHAAIRAALGRTA